MRQPSGTLRALPENRPKSRFRTNRAGTTAGLIGRLMTSDGAGGGGSRAKPKDRLAPSAKRHDAEAVDNDQPDN